MNMHPALNQLETALRARPDGKADHADLDYHYVSGLGSCIYDAPAPWIAALALAVAVRRGLRVEATSCLEIVAKGLDLKTLRRRKPPRKLSELIVTFRDGGHAGEAAEVAAIVDLWCLGASPVEHIAVMMAVTWLSYEWLDDHFFQKSSLRTRLKQWAEQHLAAPFVTAMSASLAADRADFRAERSVASSTVDGDAPR